MNTEERRLDWIMVLSVAIVVFSPVMAIATAAWTDDLDVLWSVVLVAMLTGVLISLTRFRSLTAHLLSLVYSLAWIGYLMTTSMVSLSLREKIISLFMRVSSWIALAVRGGTGRDSMMFVLLLAILFWWVGYLAIWNTVRHQRIWRALLPSGVALFINYYYYAGPSKLAPYLMVYLFCAFLVVVRSYTVLQERRWVAARIGYNSDVRFDLLRWGLVLALVAVLLAWVAPTAATSEQAYEMWRHVEGPWRHVEEDFNRLFSTLRAQARSFGDPFGRMITLRGPRTLTDTPVLEIVAPPDIRFYWRGVTYDRYTGSSWINTDNETVQLDSPWYQPRLETYSLREDITQTVTVLLQQDTLIFAAPQPSRVSVAARATSHIIRTDGAAEFSQLNSARTLRRGTTYQVISSISVADTESLRNAGTDYPAWVRERYLQLPESLPLSVRQQAKAIAGNLPTPYDQAAAVEAWLRENISYDDKTPAPPEDQDGVAYLLSIKRGYCDYYASAMIVMLRSLNVPARMAVGYAQGKYDPANGVYHVSEKDSHSWVEVYFPKYGWVEFEPTASQPPVERPKPQLGIGTPTPTPDASESDLTPGTGRPQHVPDEGDQSFGHGGGGLLNTGGTLGWLGLIGIVGFIIAIVFVAMWAIERRRPAKVRPASSAGAFSSWLGVIGLVQIAITAVFAVLWVLSRLISNSLSRVATSLSTWIGVIGLVQILVVLVLAAIRIYERRGLGKLSITAQLYARLLRFSDWLNVRWTESQTPRERGDAFVHAAPKAHGLISQIVDNYTREQYSPTPPDTSNAEQLWQATSPLLWMAGIRQRLDILRKRWHDFNVWREALARRLGNQFG